MRQTLPFVAIAAAAGALWFYSRKKRFAGSVKFGLKGIKLSGTTVIAKLSILNPSNQSATIKTVLGTLYYNGQAIATVKNFKPVTVIAAGESETDLIFVPSLLGVLSSLADLVGTKKVKGFKIVGSALVDGVLIPLNFSA
jgi:LEA14-like dessication related protein